MEKSLIITVVLAVLVIIAAIQAVQVSNLKSDLSDAGLQVSSGSSSQKVQSGAVESGSPQLPPGLDQLPGMVGAVGLVTLMFTLLPSHTTGVVVAIAACGVGSTSMVMNWAGPAAQPASIGVTV